MSFSGRRGMLFGAIVGALLAGAFLTGAWVGAHRPELAWGRGRVAPVPAEHEEKKGPSPQEILSALRVEANRLERRETGLEGEEREAEVALKLLAARGEGPGSPACREQEDRRRAASHELARVRKDRAEALRLAESLRQALREERSEEAAGLDRETERRARTWLTRRALLREGADDER